MTVPSVFAYAVLLVGFWLINPFTTAVSTYAMLAVAVCACLHGAVKDCVRAGGAYAERN